jgi:hypothetical protein
VVLARPVTATGFTDSIRTTHSEAIERATPVKKLLLLLLVLAIGAAVAYKVREA